MTLKAIAELVTPIVGLGTAVVALLTAIVGITKYFNYRTRQDEMRLIKQAFDNVIASLRSDSLIDRLSGAIILRRFFDYKTEMGSGGAPYWKVAVDVTAAILRGQTTGDFQKLLADGLAFAPTLVRADLQRTNLQFAYLGSRKINENEADDVKTDLRYADFYRADLSKASLKRANAERAVFYQARLHNTILVDAKLAGANFFEADLRGADFRGADLHKASFRNARNLPAGLQEKLDEQGIFQEQERFQQLNSADKGKTAVFVSKPGCLSASHKQKLDFLFLMLESERLTARTLEREEYPSFGVAGEVRRIVSGCAGAIIFGFSELKVLQGTWRAGTIEEKSIDSLNLPTPWSQIEAGMALMTGIPVLVVQQRGVEGGVFALGNRESGVYQIYLDDALDSPASAYAFSNWLADVREQ